ncbi:MAG: radical SAM protein [Nitrospirota bacterium]|nr:radical SAM protein [Nitrospirota bacterium]
MIKTLKPFLFSKFLYGLVRVMSLSSERALISYLNIAEKATTREHYKRAIRSIREMWRNGHPSLKVAMKVLKNTSPGHKKQIIRCFIINQLLVGSTKRKAFSESAGGFYPPGLLVISPSMKCNLNCFGCYAGMYKKDEDLPYEVLDRVLNEAKEMGVHFVVVSGGEPFFRKDLLTLFEKHSDMAFHVFTHGGLLDEKLVARLADLGNILPAISVEGFREETDRRRGEGHYERVVRAMKLLKEAGILFGYSATMTKQNAGIMVSDEFVDHWMEKGCTVGWYFLYTPVGREPNWDLVPTPAQRDLLRSRVAHFRTTKEMLFGDFWNDGPVVGGCIAGGRKYFHINSKGDVEPCVFCHFALHNIKNVSLREAVTSPLFKKIQDYQKANDNLLRPCMIIDQPHVYRDVCKMPGVYFTHQGAGNIVDQFSAEIDEYAVAYGELAEKAWDELSAKKE